ncbi:hypothetical protein R6Q59_003577 [Mikania micrantha]|uniref:TF-B3 domain-containing protein n=1 Tax=Mikania micrantha TaxID=192012 RepID=A0A5N6ML10_9ASTR|nr:hypothetical protein E3N88_30163 [Mikania micrantha]
MPSRRNFFRFITTDQSSLKIPKKFTRDHRKQILLNNALLIVSDDKVWPVVSTLSGDGKLWLQKGWPEFQQHYRLKFGHLLFFDHLGKSVFHVRIFDPSYQEIYNIPPQKYLKLEKEIVVQSASRNRAHKDNPCFSVTIRNSYLQSSIAYAPVRFCRRYLRGDQKLAICVLQMSGGRKWGPVNCRIYKNYANLCGENWKKFSEENHLGVGDVCLFELINELENVMEVTISRAC